MVRRIFSIGGLITLVIVLSVGGVIGFFVYRAVFGDIVTLQDHPLVAVESCSRVRIVSNTSSNRIVIRINNDDYTREIDGNTLYVQGQGCFDANLEVPANTDLQVNASSSLDIIGVTGEMQLKGGQIRLFQTTLQGKSTIASSSDYLAFNGALDQQADVTITASTSPVDIELPDDASFTCDVVDNPQSFNTNFPNFQVAFDEHIAQTINSVHGTVGTGQARLTISARGSQVLLTGI